MNNSEQDDERREILPAPALIEPEEPVQPERRPRSFWARFLRWALVLLIFFGLGVLAAVWFLYLPVSERLSQGQTELEQARDQITELESDVERLTPMGVQNEALQEELASARVHTLILSSLADVNAARLALAEENIAIARTQLSNTAEELGQLEGSVGEDQRELVLAMQERLELALDEMDRDLFAAQSDLEVLATNLIQLENILFAQP